MSIDSTSETLLKRLRQTADQQAWGRFVDLYGPLLYYWACRTGCRKADAADLVQEVLALLVKKLRDFDYKKQGNFRSWLRTVAHNCWRNQQRRAKLPLDDVSSLARIPDAENDPFWEEEYRQHLAHKALELMQVEFQPSTWKACWETVVHSKPAEQVAAELDMTVGAVYVAKSRVLSRLRQELSGLLE